MDMSGFEKGRSFTGASEMGICFKGTIQLQKIKLFPAPKEFLPLVMAFRLKVTPWHI